MQYDLGMSLSNNIRLGNIYPLGSVFLLYFIIGRNWNGFVYCIVWPGCQCPPVSISNGNFTYKALNRSECGAVVTFICDPGYLLNGSVTVVCRNYSWSPPLPKCESRNMIFYTEYTIIIINLEWICKYEFKFWKFRNATQYICQVCWSVFIPSHNFWAKPGKRCGAKVKRNDVSIWLVI